MRVLFRVDSSFVIGTGHVSRCLNLAILLRDKHIHCEFICLRLEGSLIEKILNTGFKVNLLQHRIKGEFNLDHENGTFPLDENFDSQEVVKFLLNNNFDFLIVDHYSLDFSWERAVRNFVKKIFVIDDLANRRHDCDFLLDQNFVAQYQSRYKTLAPKNCKFFFGPKYAIFNKNFEKKRQLKTFKDKPSSILIYFGGSVINNLTQIAIEAVIGLMPELILNIVLSSKNPLYQSIKDRYTNFANVNIYSDLPDLSEIILQSDIGIGAGGTTSLERCFLGMPSIVVSIAENQVEISKALDQIGIIKYLGHFNNVSGKDIQKSLLEILESKNFRCWSTKCFNFMDTSGGDRIVEELLKFN